MKSAVVRVKTGKYYSSGFLTPESQPFTSTPLFPRNPRGNSRSDKKQHSLDCFVMDMQELDNSGTSGILYLHS